MGTYMHAHILYYARGYHGICLNHSQSSQEYNSPHYAYKNSTTSITVSIVRCCSTFCIRNFTKQSLHAPSSSWNATQHLSGMHPGQARYWLHKRQSLLERPLWFLQTKQSRDLTMSNVWLLQTQGGMLEHLKHGISAFRHIHMNSSTEDPECITGPSETYICCHHFEMGFPGMPCYFTSDTWSC